MKNIKKLVLLGFIVSIILIGNAVFAGYIDVSPEQWYSGYIEQAETIGLICGYDDGTFRPGNSMTNAEFMKLAVKLSGADIHGPEYSTENVMQYAREQGYLMDDELIDHNAPVTRQNIAKVISRILKLSKIELSSVSQKITDWDITCPKCKPDIAKCYANGIICGYPDGTFRGRYTATRAETVAVLIKAGQWMK